MVQTLLRKSKFPRDSLPYVSEFDTLKGRFESARKVKIGDHDFWMLLCKIGKYGGLSGPGKRKKGTKAPILSDSEQMEILRLLPDGIGNRDHLPYTERFDEMHRRFAKFTGKKLGKHEFWRAVSNVAKAARKFKPVYETAPVGSLAPELVTFLENQNPWWRAQPAKQPQRFRRWAFNEMVARMQNKLAPIVAIRGSRRVGKSVLQAQLIEDLLLMGRPDTTGKPVSASRILSVQFDDAPALGGISMPIQAIVRWFEENILKRTLNKASKDGEPVYLFFDEVQNLPDWSVQLKILADNTDARILVTGSSALRIAKGQDNLAGRMTTIELGPLRLWEVAGIRGLRGLVPYAPDAPLETWKTREFWLGLIQHGKKHAKQRDEAFRLFSEFGGYPLCHSTPGADADTLRQQVVREVITKTIEHDPGNRPHTAPLDPAFVRDVFRMVCRYAGQAVTPKRLADELQALLESAIPNARVLEAMDFLTDSLLVAAIPPLELLAKKQGHPPKLCVCDHFVRDGILQETLPLDPDAIKGCNEAVATQVGHVIESVLGYFLKGIPGVELSWFPPRGKEPEVDFTLTIGTHRIPVEVKYRRSTPSNADVAGIEAFCGKPAYAADFGLIVTQSHEGPVGECAIAVPASTFLLLR